MRYLLLARHGNTFSPQDKVVWVGANNDVPLVESGIKQADNLAQAICDHDIMPDTIYAGTLKRTASYAQMVANKLNIAVRLDNRLHEIDYGGWSGLSDQEIKEQFGNNEFDQWQNQGAWPVSFASSEQETIDQVFSFAEEAIVNQPNKKLALAVTSNGRLKYFLKLLPYLWKDFTGTSKWKVSTGKVSLLSFTNSGWAMICWNEDPYVACSLIRKTE